MTFIEKAASAYRAGKYRSMAAAMKAMSKSKAKANPKKAKSKSRRSASADAAKAMRLFRSGKARSLKAAWAMVR
jgi:hypothetical protein